MKKILITGSLGLVGSACVELFKEKRWEVVGIDNNGRSKFFKTQKQELGETMEIDFTNNLQVSALFDYYKFDAIIHCGGQPSHDYATDHVIEDFETNAYGTLVLLEATRKYCPEATFVHVSTDKVYGENMVIDLEETETRYESVYPQLNGFDEDLGLDFAGDRSFFGCSKAAADMYAQQYAARGMKVGIFRPGCITGKNHQGAEQHGFLAYLAKCIKEGKTYKIYGFKGKQVRDQIHASDFANAIWCFNERPRAGGVYNIGGGPERSVSVLEAGQMVSKATGKEFKYELAEARPGDRIYDVHDVSKFREDYPEFEYRFSLKDIIDELSL